MDNQFQTPQEQAPTKIIVAIVVILVLIAAIFILKGKMGKQKVADTMNTNAAVDAGVQKTAVPKEKLPENLPAGIPMEAGANVTLNENVTTKDGRLQATREFETKKTLAENYTLYSDFLKNNGYKIDGTLDQPTSKMVAGTKGTDQLQISMNENSITKVKTVTIIWTKAK